MLRRNNPKLSHSLFIEAWIKKSELESVERGASSFFCYSHPEICSPDALPIVLALPESIVADVNAEEVEARAYMRELSGKIEIQLNGLSEPFGVITLGSEQ